MGPWRTLLLVMLAGGLGSGVRFVGATGIARLTGQTFPWGTLTVNLLGSFLIGLLGFFALEAKVISRDLALVLTAGFLGGLTTFSSFALEGERLLARRELLQMGSYLLGSVILGVTMVWLGARVGRWLA